MITTTTLQFRFCSERALPLQRKHRYSLLLTFLMTAMSLSNVYALQGVYGIHDPSTIVKYNGVYHIWGTGNQIYHLTSPDLINWSTASTVFASGTWPSWINTYVSGFAGDFWAPECVYMNGKYYMYYACSTFGSKVSAIGVATSTDLVNWSDQGMVIYSNNSSAYNCIDPSVFTDASGNYWLTFGSHWSGIWMAQLNPSTGKRLNTTLYNVAGNGSSSEHEAPYVVRSGGYYYLFFNRGACCNGVNSTYYVSMGRSTSPTGPYVDQNGVSLMSNGGTVVLSTSGKYIGPGQIGLYQENGYNFLTYHYYDGNNNGAPTLSVGNMGWNSGWPFITRDWVAAGRYKVINKNSGLVWDDWGCTGASLQPVAQNTSTGVICQQWDFATLGNGTYKITCAKGGLAAEVYQCSAVAGAKIDIYSYWGGTCQQYQIEKAGDGSLVFEPLNGNGVVEVPNASTATGVQLDLWDYNGNNCQRWILGTAGVAGTAEAATAITASVTNLTPGLSDHEEKGMKVYPNPSLQGNFYIDPGSDNKTSRIVIVDTNGKEMYTCVVTGGGIHNIASNLQPGVYFVKIAGGNTIITKKLLVVK